MTPEKLAELEALLERATARPWSIDGLEIGAPGRGIVARFPTPQGGGTMECSANAPFVFAAFNALPDLIAAVRNPASDMVEREAVVAFLRNEGAVNLKVDIGGSAERSAKVFARACIVIADAIERGEHLTKAGRG